MPLATAQVTVTSSVTAVCRTVRGSTDILDSTTALIKNAGATTVFLGGSAVTAATGFALAAGDVLTADLIPGDDVYGITASGTSVVHVLKMRQ